MIDTKLPIKMLLIHAIQNCNSPCVMCDCWKTKGKVQLQINDLSKTIDIFSKNGGNLVMISGGEPTLHKQIVEILSYCKSKDLQIAFNTNGILLHKRIDEIHSYCDYIVVSIDSANRQLYKQLRGVDMLEQVTTNVKTIRKNFPHIKIQFRCTISRINLFDFLDVVTLAQELNISGVGFSPIDFDSKSFARSDAYDQQTYLNQFIPDNDELNSFIEHLNGVWKEKIEKFVDMGLITWNSSYFLQLYEYFKKIRIPSHSPRQSQTCFFPFTSVLVDYDGSLRGCFYSTPFSSIHNITDFDFANSNRIYDIEKENICNNCRGKVFT